MLLDVLEDVKNTYNGMARRVFAHSDLMLPAGRFVTAFVAMTVETLKPQRTSIKRKICCVIDSLSKLDWQENNDEMEFLCGD